MKKFYTLLLVVLAMLLPTIVSADSVNQEQALAKAAQFFAQGPQTRTAPQFELIWDGEEAATRATAEPAFFIFNRTDAPGFVIIAGDDAVSPVIGYSFENGFGKGEMPSNLRYWLEGVREMVFQARAAGAPAVDQTPVLGDPVKLLETADWDQKAPYNSECPTYGGQRSVTGCVATACSIVCKFNRWPDTGTGTVPAYKTRTRELSVAARTLGTPYNYDLMPNVYGSSYTEAEGAEVARLMADIGAAVKADYQPSGTGAFTTDQLKAMVTYMRYNKAARLALRDGYTDDEWKALMKAEINADRPVLYSASSDAGGHAFVLDGYTNDDMFYFNWGWSGSANGAYSVNNMAPANSGYNFTSGHEALVDLTPDKEGTSTTYADCLVVGAQNNYVGLYVSTKIFATGSTFSAQLLYYNIAATGYTGKVALALADKNYTIKELITNEQTTTVRSASDGSIYAGVTNFSATITAEIKPGDRIIPIYWDRATNGWLRMRKYIPEAIDEVIVMEADPDGDAIASNTQISWNRTKKELSIRSYNGATMEILKADGSKVLSQTVGSEAVMLSNPTAGTYTVRIYFDAAEACEFKVKL